MLHSFARKGRRDAYTLKFHAKSPVKSDQAELDVGDEDYSDENRCEENIEPEKANGSKTAKIGVLKADRLGYRPQTRPAYVPSPFATHYSALVEKEAPVDEIVRLNVGGTIFTTLRSTLCSVPGSMLEAMFSGRFGSPAMKDESGAYFLDRDANYFGLVLSYLRDPRNRPVVKVGQSRMTILREFEYFGLLPDAGVYVAEGSDIICTHHLELASRFSSMSVYGSRAYVSTETHIELWCLDAQECVRKLKLIPGLFVRSLEATATNCFVLCGDCEIQVWDAELLVLQKSIDPGTGWASHFQLVHDLYDSRSVSAYSTVSAFSYDSLLQRRAQYPPWSFKGVQRGPSKRSLLFFDGDLGIYALDLDSLAISTVVEVKEKELAMAFHVSGEELYYATEGALNSFNLRTYKKALLASTAVEFKRIRAIENELLVCWGTMGDRLIHFDLRTRNFTSSTPSDRWHPLTEQCEVFRSLAVGRDFSNRIVLWCTNPLLDPENGTSSFQGQEGLFTSQAPFGELQIPRGSAELHHHQQQHNMAYSSSSAPSSAAAKKAKVVSLFNDPTPTASSYFFQFQGSSIVVATSSPNDPSRNPTAQLNGNGIAGALGAGDMEDVLSAAKQQSLPSGSIRVFSIRR